MRDWFFVGELAFETGAEAQARLCCGEVEDSLSDECWEETSELSLNLPSLRERGGAVLLTVRSPLLMVNASAVLGLTTK